MIKQNQKQLNGMVVILDSCSIILSLLLSWFIRFKSGLIHVEGDYLPLIQYIKPSIILIPLYLLMYNFLKLYMPRRIKSIYDEFLSIIKGNIFGILLFILILYLLKEMNYSRYFLLLFLTINTISTTLERGFIRYILHELRRNGKNLKHIILVGYSDLTKEFLKEVNANRHWGYNVIGVLDNKLYDYKQYIDTYENLKCSDMVTGEARRQAAAAIEHDLKLKDITNINFEKVLGKYKDLDKVVNKYDVDDIFITLSLEEYDKLGNIIEACEKNGVRTQIIPDYYKYIPAKPYVEEVGGLPIINIRYVPLENLVNKIIKRLFDIIVSILCIIISSPIMLLTTLIIKLTSPGPMIFKQERIGLNRKAFTMYKFRSMHVQNPNEEKQEWTSKDDPRKTKFGAFIRKTSIDELPQFFNVLRGDMSIIGPRPERPYFVEKFKEEIPKYMVKHQVRPGITGWAQVNGYRGDTSIVKRIEHDIYYIENWSLSLDMKIMWFTLFKGFVNKNAY